MLSVTKMTRMTPARRSAVYCVALLAVALLVASACAEARGYAHRVPVGPVSNHTTAGAVETAEDGRDATAFGLPDEGAGALVKTADLMEPEDPSDDASDSSDVPPPPPCPHHHHHGHHHGHHPHPHPPPPPPHDDSDSNSSDVPPPPPHGRKPQGGRAGRVGFWNLRKARRVNN